MCQLTPCSETCLPDDATAPSVARDFLRHTYCEKHAAGVLDSAVLLVSELVTNAVWYGAPPIVLAVDCEGAAGLRVRVRDAEPAPPSSWTTSPYSERGPQVYLVDLVSDVWGVEPQPHGKEVWFQLRDHHH